MKTAIAVSKKLKSRAKHSSLHSLLVGVGSLLNVIPGHTDTDLMKVCPNDTYSLRSDWNAVGSDIHAALEKAKENH